MLLDDMLTEQELLDAAAEQRALRQPPVCVKCGHPAMRSWGGWSHAPGRTDRRRHVIEVEQA